MSQSPERQKRINAEYADRQKQIAHLISRLQEGLENHAAQPGPKHYGHIGDLGAITETLSDLADRLNGTGEYAN
jgi:hypothetical protein